jgi:hypothetical protein
MPDGEYDLGGWWIQQRGRIDQESRALFDLMLLLCRLDNLEGKKLLSLW